MAYGKWNAGLGGLASSNYTNSVIEKTIVYGKEIMGDVRYMIETCNTSCVNHYIVNDNDIEGDPDIPMIILGALIAFSFIAGGSMLYYNKCIKNNNNDMSFIPVNDIISDL
tara:strand:+ start:259 stop:591 length:333 start_codon:yes stop_codon:yes gene_type:complete